MRRAFLCGLAVVAAAAAVSVGAPEPSRAVVPCPKMDPTLTTDRILWNAGLREVSGIQASVDHPGVLWVIQDSGNGPYLHAFSIEGDRLATYTLSGARLKNVDWEAIGLDHRFGIDLIVIGDIGDNRENRDGVARTTPSLYVLAEPVLEATQSPPLIATLSGVSRYPFRYYDDAGAAVWKPRDAESLFVDTRSHNVFILWKHLATVDGASKRSRVFELADQDLMSGTQNRARHVADVVGAGAGVGTGPVSADIAADGEWIVVKNYAEGFLWRRAKGQGVAEAMASAPAAPCSVVVDAAEAIAFTYNDTGVWVGFLSLREDPDGNPPLHQVQRSWV
jgi:hypothetical protein